MTTSHLYLLVEQGGKAFKIGKADDPTRRAATLPNEIDYSRSLAFAFSARCVIRAEKSLHFLFRAHRLTNRARQDGSTEWFRMAAFEDVKRFLWVNRALLGWTDWSIVKPPCGRPGRPLSRDSTSRMLSAKEHREREAERELTAQHIKERNDRRRAAIAALDDLTAQAFTERGLTPPQKRPRKSFKAKSGPVVRIDPKNLVNGQSLRINRD